MADQLELAITVIGKEDRRLGATIAKTKKSIVGLSRSAEKSVLSLSSAIEKRNALLDQRAIFKSQAVGIAAMAGAIAAPVAAAVQFESVMADVTKVVNDISPQGLTALRRDILDLASGSAITAAGVGEIVAAAGEAGIVTKDLRQFAQDTIEMSVAFGISAEQAGKTMAIWRSSMGLTRDESMNLGDAINLLGNSIAASSADITRIFGRVQGVGKVAGLANKDIAALAGAFKATGVGTEIAATGMQNMLLALTRGKSATKKQASALEGLGFNSGKLAQAMQEDATGSILSVLEAFKDVDKADLPALIEEIFGRESIKPIAKLIGSTKLLRKALGLVNDETQVAGSLTKEYQVRAATTENAISEFTGKINVLGITLGSVLLPPLNKALTAFGKGLDVVIDLGREFPLITKTIVGLVGSLVTARVGIFLFKVVTNEAKIALAGFSILMKSTALSAGFLGKAFGVLSTGVKVAMTVATLAFRTFAAVVIANPVGATIAGLALLAGTIITNWEPIKAFFTGFWDGFIQFANQAINTMRKALGLQTKIDTGAKQTLGSRRGRRQSRAAAISSSGIQGQPVIGSVLPTGRVGGGRSRRSRRARAVQPLDEQTVAPIAAAGGGSGVVNDNSRVENTFNITQQAGESGQALAERVSQASSRAGVRRRRRALHDGNDKAE